MPLGDPAAAFYVGADEHRQRYAYPATDAGRRYFDACLGDFDVSELGWELDTTYDAFDRAMSAAGLHWE